MRGFEVEELGVGDNMSGLVRVMEWTSVLVILLPIPKEGKQRVRAVQQKITDKVSCFIELIVLETN